MVISGAAATVITSVILTALMQGGSGSQGLTRPRALELIKAAAASEKASATILIDVGESVPNFMSAPMFRRKHEALQAAGLVEIRNDPFAVLLTPKGQEAARGAKQEQFSVFAGLTRIYLPAANIRQVVAVTGILQDRGLAEAEFTWRWGTLTVIGEALANHGVALDLSEVKPGAGPNPLQAGAATFRRYDDGWRVTGVSFPLNLPN